MSMDEAVQRVAAGGLWPPVRRHHAGMTAISTISPTLCPVFEAHETPFTIYVAPALTERRMGLWWEMVEDIVTRRGTGWSI